MGFLWGQAPKLTARILFVAIVIAPLNAFAFQESPALSSIERSDTPKCRTRLQKIVQVGLVSSLLGVVGSFAPSVIYDLHAQSQNKTHIGHGLYFSWENIQAHTHPKILVLLEDPKVHELAIVRYYTGQLYGDYESESGLDLLPIPRDASEYLSSCSTRRGVCRHKSIILKAILDHLGIPAQLQIGYGESSVPHMWVYLPNLDLVADPTGNKIQDRIEYHAWFFQDPQKAEAFHRQVLGFNNWQLTPFEMGWFR